MQYNIDLGSHIDYYKLPPELKALRDNYTAEDILNQTVDLSVLKKYGYGMTANFEFFDNKEGKLIPRLMLELFTKRKTIKKQSGYHANQMAILESEGKLGTPEYKEHELQHGYFDSMQHSIKNMINSLYGALTNKFFKYFKYELGESITTTGQLVNRVVGKAVDEFVVDVVLEGVVPPRPITIYGDTDSRFFDMESVIAKFGMTDKSDEEITTFLDTFVKEVLSPVIVEATQKFADYTNAYQDKMDWERENIFKSLIMTAKKRYIMMQMDNEGKSYVHNPHYKIMGLDAIKSSTPKWSQPLLIEAYRRSLTETEKDIQDFVMECEVKFSKLSLEEIAIPRGVSNIEKYMSYDETLYVKGTPKHVKACIIHNNQVEVRGLSNIPKLQAGNKIKMLTLKKVNPIGQEVIGFANYLPKEFELENSIDKQIMFQKGFLQPLDNFITALNWSHEPVNKIDDFFSFV